ncbi:hypothetical protein [Streptococcus ruminantium]|uniref:hypothetical protein n=1 Tax=Streptococcus ruminantium TaxID=1917441 RepID=UPI0015AED955|nr:hypothetical protein [Streptococcus ruminantium]
MKIKQVLTSLFILIGMMSLLGGCGMSGSEKEEVKYKSEQDRVVNYLLENYELTNGDKIKTIEFIEFEKNNITGTWRITTRINEKYDISFNQNELNGQLRSSNYSPKEFKKRNVDYNHTQNVHGIKIIYYEE